MITKMGTAALFMSPVTQGWRMDKPVALAGSCVRTGSNVRNRQNPPIRRDVWAPAGNDWEGLCSLLWMSVSGKDRCQAQK